MSKSHYKILNSKRLFWFFVFVAVELCSRTNLRRITGEFNTGADSKVSEVYGVLAWLLFALE